MVIGSSSNGISNGSSSGSSSWSSKSSYKSSNRIRSILVISVVVVGCIHYLYNIHYAHEKIIMVLKENVPEEAVFVAQNIQTKQQLQQQQQWKLPDDDLTIDIISIGSWTRKEYQRGQIESFGSHGNVRYFFSIDESHEIDPNCSSTLTDADMKSIVRFCYTARALNKRYPLYGAMKNYYARTEWLYKKANPVGWLCAQKRPWFGLNYALDVYAGNNTQPYLNPNYHHYHHQQQLHGQQHQQQISTIGTLSQQQQQPPPQFSMGISFPDYLILMDDDTYYNMNAVSSYLHSTYKSSDEEPLVIAGCLIRLQIEHLNFTFPYGGWGTIFSKGFLKNLVTPIDCSVSSGSNKRKKNVPDTPTTTTPKHVNKSSIASSTSPSTTFTFNMDTICKHLQDNFWGEQQLFHSGMNLFELITAFVLPSMTFGRWKEWKRSQEYCFHSDWIWGFFFNYYNISKHLGLRTTIPVDRMGAYNDSIMYFGDKTNETLSQFKQCDYDSDDKCTPESHICHYITPEAMMQLYHHKNQTANTPPPTNKQT